MNKLSNPDRAAVVRCLVEGNSIRATVRMTGVAKNTIAKLILDLGAACAKFQNAKLVGLTTKRVECDEIWAFVGMKEKRVPAERKDELGVGDVWTWVALDADSKLCVSWMIGERDTATAIEFMQDVADRLTNRVQLTTDGHKPYLVAVDLAFAGEVDYSMLHKTYGTPGVIEARRYSPPKIVGTSKETVCGAPDEDVVSTSYVERQNLTMRMGMRRFTRLTNGFSKRYANHCAAVSLHFMHYNFGRKHMSLKGQTPAMAAKLADHVWTAEEIVALLAAN